MAILAPMPQVNLPTNELLAFGAQWTANDDRLSRTPPYSSLQLGTLANTAVATALATMLGGIPIVAPISSNALLPPHADSVELGEIRVVGGVRPKTSMWVIGQMA
jgi:hypothetical protein